MLKIRISYNTQQELQTVLKLLRPVIKSCKISKNETGRFKRAYIDTK